MRKRVLVTGASGMLGHEIVRALQHDNRYEILGVSNSFPLVVENVKCIQTDLTIEENVNLIFKKPFDIIIHCAALTDLSLCENNYNLAKAVNVETTRHLVNNIKNTGGKLIYISTDSVFNGKEGNYTEMSNTNPINNYAKTKLLGEIETSKLENYLILRMNIFGKNIQPKNSLGEWMIDNFENKIEFNGFKDVIFNPVFTQNVLPLIFDLINYTGIYNLGSSDYCSKYDFGLMIAEIFGFSPNLIKPISIDELDLKVERPKNTTLDITNLSSKLTNKKLIKTVRQQIMDYYASYFENNTN